MKTLVPEFIITNLYQPHPNFTTPDMSPRMASYVCIVCDNLFQSLENLNAHMVTFHGEMSTYVCYKCDNFFGSNNDLAHHIDQEHKDILQLNLSLTTQPSPVSNSPPPVHCNFCGYSSQTMMELNYHVRDHRGLTSGNLSSRNYGSDGGLLQVSENSELQTQPNTCSCNVCHRCNLTFDQFFDLCEHLRTNHNPETCFPCEVCEIVFTSLPSFKVHILNHTDVRSQSSQQDPLSPIIQVDGTDLDVYEFSNIPTCSSTITANYTLNQNKQTSKIVKDVSINDYDITINNEDQNVTIKCSAGFYIQ